MYNQSFLKFQSWNKQMHWNTCIVGCAIIQSMGLLPRRRCLILCIMLMYVIISLNLNRFITKPSSHHCNAHEYWRYISSCFCCLRSCSLFAYDIQVARLFNDAAQMSPEDADVHIVLGVLHNLSREYDKAIAYFKTALKLKPRDYSLWNKLGATQANSVQSADAIEAYQQVLHI